MLRVTFDMSYTMQGIQPLKYMECLMFIFVVLDRFRG